MNHKGDRVRIRSKEWMEAQALNENGEIVLKDSLYNIVQEMFQYAGLEATIINVIGKRYDIDIDGGMWCWCDLMFDPDYNPADNPLSAEDAIIAMVQGGETLYDKDGWGVFWNKHKKEFVLNNGEISIAHKWLTGLCRRPEKRKRLMTNDEAIAWASGSESLGWMVRYTRGPWMFPRSYEFTKTIREYQRARMLPDLSGIDESTIQGFEVEEVE